jgi:hypothetical protein
VNIFCALVFFTALALAPEHTAVIDAVREYALSYTKRLPNYTCTLTTRQVTRPPNMTDNADVRLTLVEEELGFADSKEIRGIKRIDGRAVSQQEAADQPEGQPEGMSRGEFGNLLDIIFEPVTGADLRWDRAATLENRRVDVIAFHVPQARGYLFKESRGNIRVPFEGFVYADAQTHAVLRIQMKCTMIPDKSDIRTFDLALDYRAMEVGGRDFILPSRFVMHYMDAREDRQHTNDGRYSGCRRFGADASIRFEGDKE